MHTTKVRNQDYFTIGLSISLTGKFAREGRQAFQGVQLWCEQSRAKLVHYDDESRIGRAVENVRLLLERDRVDILFGPYSSGLALAVAKVAEQHGRVMWNHGGSSDDIVGGWVVSTPSPASQYFRRLPIWLAGNAPGIHRITGMRSTRGTFAQHVIRGLAEVARTEGYSLELLPIASEAPPVTDILVLAGSFSDEVNTIRSRPAVRILAAVAAGVGGFYEELGPMAEGVIGPSQWEPVPETEWFVRRFQERFGCPPEYTAAGAFAIGEVVEECLRRTGSLDDIRLREAATHLDFETFYGRFRIDPDDGRQVGHGACLVRWERGRKVIIEAGRPLVET